MNRPLWFLAAGMLIAFGPVSAAASGRPQGPLVYVSDDTSGVIDVFNSKARKVRQIVGIDSPMGLLVDRDHNLWVANPRGNDVLVFRRGAARPTHTLVDEDEPNDVALCPDGTAYVADSGGRGGISVFPPGRTRRARRLEAQQNGAGGLEYFVTCDTSGNVFATGLVGPTPFYATTGWRGGKQAGYYLLPGGGQTVAGIKATRSNTLLISTLQGSVPSVIEYTEAGKPTGRYITTGADVWSAIVFDENAGKVYGADSNYQQVVSVKFPSGTVTRRYRNWNLLHPTGVAVDR
ncbi:MAG: hypothetical protein JO060_06395 [Candidatus Eremiobacteraeota bacterium]|nr:hypothetical protein [Candidatus Eremiobacteraeota bacterium]